MNIPERNSLRERLIEEQKRLSGTAMTTLFELDPDRACAMQIQAAGLDLDFSKNRIDRSAMAALVGLARAHQLEAHRDALFRGEPINTTEQRQVLHPLLRGAIPGQESLRAQVETTLTRIEQFVHGVHSGLISGITDKPFRTVINIGIGGSHLGPAMTCRALKPYAQRDLDVQFVSNVDASDISQKLRNADPETTLFIVASKTFTTQETLANAHTARNWLIEQTGRPDAVERHFAAISTATDRIAQFGIRPTHIFPMWDWVGGRYSIWSSIGLPLALAIGYELFTDFHRGAAEMDRHFQKAPLEQNMPVILALLSYWYLRFWGAETQALLPYDHYLGDFPAYVQQLDMESNGKSTSLQGERLHQATSPIIWGTEGTNGQHSFHQLLHQGNLMVPVDFILPLRSHNPIGAHQDLLVANCLGQSRALMVGKSLEEAITELGEARMDDTAAKSLAPHKTMPGNRPSNTILMDKLTPSTLGALIALYEHKVFVQSVLHKINAFDQWGVELGKQICTALLPYISNEQPCSAFDESTNRLLNQYRSVRNS
ncbi:Glucose-6-phosphate isomerase [Microbulbifer aggregans]|uniref:Glucose-6-phosphate isomerase n=1 Tax=Microbulbifer aggregans TaxID=1769779 RepID=A0A1C9WBX1_9GAMM|nr:glucose-6-phosphate isomerase [Microbulbifer aggregans]AOS98640.1 Glucose-6-phosphate isomerase [Microbulbifer aggregans]